MTNTRTRTSKEVRVLEKSKNIVNIIMTFKKYLAELTATFGFVLLAAGSVLANNFTQGKLGVTGIALAHGLGLMAMIYAVMNVSGAHLNPAVTIAMWATKKIKTKEGVGYIISQLIGSAIAGLFLLWIFPNGKAVNFGAPALASGITLFGGILIEAVFTFLLVLTVYGVAVDKRSPPGPIGLAIGVIVVVALLVAGPLTGAALNPARAFGPALVAGFWTNHLVYWIGPIIGAVIAGLAYNNLLLGKEVKKEKLIKSK